MSFSDGLTKDSLRTTMMGMTEQEIHSLCGISEAVRELFEEEPETFERRTVKFMSYETNIELATACVCNEDGTEEMVKVDENVNWFVHSCQISNLHFQGNNEILNFTSRWFETIENAFLDLSGDNLEDIVGKLRNCKQLRICYPNFAVFDNLMRRMRSITFFYFYGPDLHFTDSSLSIIKTKVANGDGIHFFLTTSALRTTLADFLLFITTVKLCDSYPVHAFGLLRILCTFKQFIEAVKFEPDVEFFSCDDHRAEGREPDIPGLGIEHGSSELPEVGIVSDPGVLFGMDVDNETTETEFINNDGLLRTLVSDPIIEVPLKTLNEKYRIQLFVKGKQCILCADFNE